VAKSVIEGLQELRVEEKDGLAFASVALAIGHPNEL
jgi:hypothetical protein